jgi:hypothetical protein
MLWKTQRDPCAEVPVGTGRGDKADDVWLSGRIVILLDKQKSPELMLGALVFG